VHTLCACYANPFHQSLKIVGSPLAAKLTCAAAWSQLCVGMLRLISMLFLLPLCRCSNVKTSPYFQHCKTWAGVSLLKSVQLSFPCTAALQAAYTDRAPGMAHVCALVELPERRVPSQAARAQLRVGAPKELGHWVRL